MASPDLAWRKALAGCPKPSLRERACSFASKHITARTRDFTAVGIPRHYLALMCREGLLVRIGHGVYRAADREVS
ncbi:MAG: type IV toxin-antitoxin system AbiEi family antitoxin domain-containing protein [Sphingomonas sp.]|uniref:type IV toxin-antitoxin system AbiEi family antitoxin domain-containing protein n=1 Tax=Sphingomonas sp. TaxID=28214 RepID=UPI0025D66C26|nr:type IV toxin-antitoxin system AbiEi family antitoxin domain-containing protein [Sphingomonas sp.]MBQ1497044.1 type IV toxin-antitoxin system AbiEi family antitoxin domain-containing protein [Sphingomonas sp.]